MYSLRMKALISLAAFGCWAMPLAAQPGLSPDLADGWMAYEERFAHAAGTYTSTAKVREGKDNSTQKAKVSFAYTRASRRAELKIIEPTLNKPIWRVTGANSKYVFRLEHGGAGWVLREVMMVSNTAAKPYQDELSTLLNPVRSLVAIDDTRLVDLLDDLVAGPGPGGRGTTLTLSKERTIRAQHTTTYRKLTIEIDDDKYHTLKSARADVQLNKSVGSIEYAIDRREVGGIPVPVRSTRAERFTGTADWSMETSAETDFDIDPTADLPESEFTLSHYGLPEPVGVEWKKPTPRYLWFLVAAGAFVALAVGFRYLARRRAATAAGEKPNAPPP